MLSSLFQISGDAILLLPLPPSLQLGDMVYIDVAKHEAHILGAVEEKFDDGPVGRLMQLARL